MRWPTLFEAVFRPFVKRRPLEAEIEMRAGAVLDDLAGEPNGERLWETARRRVADEVLFPLWREGRLLGAKPEEAFFVRCDRTTMTQADLDDGRLVALVGFAPLRPAEFQIIRIDRLRAA
jgi:phage tail sheath protein FI